MLKTLINNKLVGGTLLVTGTAIGGGLLALPVATAEAGFFNSLGLMIACWLLMTTSALLTLEISLWLPTNANIISMTQKFLNRESTFIAWTSYLLLFYSLVAAYISGGADFLSNLIQYYWHYSNLQPLAAIIFTGLLGSVVYQGMHSIDYLNRGLMTLKFILYGTLVVLVLPHISLNQLHEGNIRYIANGFGVLITSFSYTNIIPSLRTYFKKDIASLRKAILIGSTIPLLCYILWNASVMGVIPLYGRKGLIQISHSSYPTSALMGQLNKLLHSPLLSICSYSFSGICVLTTFLTCSLGLSDFLADGLKLPKKTSLTNDLIVYTTAFLPPLLIAIFFPGIFITALNYAGIYCLILFILLPVMIAWKGRYHAHAAKPSLYQLPGGKPILIALGSAAIAGIFYSLYCIFIL